jgi:hypothetical protein
MRRDQDPFAGPPVFGVDDQIVDAPVGLLDEEILDMTNVSIGRMDVVALDRLDAAQVRIVPVPLRVRGLVLIAPRRRPLIEEGPRCNPQDVPEEYLPPGLLEFRRAAIAPLLSHTAPMTAYRDSQPTLLRLARRSVTSSSTSPSTIVTRLGVGAA